MFNIEPGKLFVATRATCGICLNEHREIADFPDITTGTVIMILTEPYRRTINLRPLDTDPSHPPPKTQTSWACKILIADKTMELIFSGLKSKEDYVEYLKSLMKPLEDVICST